MCDSCGDPTCPVVLPDSPDPVECPEDDAGIDIDPNAHWDGEMLKEALKKYGVSNAEMERALGCSGGGVVSQWVKRKGPLGVRGAYRNAAILNFIKNGNFGVLPVKPTLASENPELAKDWHSTKNGSLTPAQVTPGSHKKVWWSCPSCGHEWQTMIAHRNRGNGCPACSGRVTTSSNCLLTINPELAKEWHPKKNGSLTPDQVTPSSNKKVWWLCPSCGHEWKTTVAKRNSGRGCPSCSGKVATSSNCLLMVNPELAKEWHSRKNGSLTPDQVTPSSNKKVWWLCPSCGHEWKTTVANRNAGHGCPACAGKVTTSLNCLLTVNPELAKEWHPRKNGSLTPDQVTPGTDKKVWWLCSSCGHEWKTTVAGRNRGSGCPACAGHVTTPTNNLLTINPDLAKEWHPRKNGSLTPDQVTPGTDKKVWWLCSSCGHEWDAAVGSRNAGHGCPSCSGRVATSSHNLLVANPDLAKEWHPKKNGSLTPDQVTPNSGKKVWWQCSSCGHEWDAAVGDRNVGKGCSVCYARKYNRWDRARLLHFFRAFLEHLKDDGVFAQNRNVLYALMESEGMVNSGSQRSHTGLLEALSKGNLDTDEIEKFVNGDPSVIDEILSGDEDADDTSDNPLLTPPKVDDLDDLADDDVELPKTNVSNMLNAVKEIVGSSDSFLADFIVCTALRILWSQADTDFDETLREVESFDDTEVLFKRVKEEFLKEAYEVNTFELPKGYAFKVNGKHAEPNLMQKRIAVRLKAQKRRGNFSGTGAGKTLSAVLASRYIESKLTLILCPNATVQGWSDAIMSIFPDSTVSTDWEVPQGNHHRFIVLNVEKLQQTNTEGHLAHLLSHKPDLVVVDEVHQFKQRGETPISQRRSHLNNFLASLDRINPDFHLLAMSATPVINDLTEGKTLLELITGQECDDLDTKATIGNCQALFRQLCKVGERHMPNYPSKVVRELVPVDCEDVLPDILHLTKPSVLDIEVALTKVRAKRMAEDAVKGEPLLVYTYYKGKGIVKTLRDEFEAKGFTVGVFTGDDHTGLDLFVNGDVDVLIASKTIATGVDGLQHMCKTMFINTLPWTHAEYKQLQGRIHRQGQAEDVSVRIYLTETEVNGEMWSWCATRWQRILHKKSLADAAVDGIIPDEHMPTQKEALEHVMTRLQRLETGELRGVVRTPIHGTLQPSQMPPAANTTPKRQLTEFSKMNQRWNVSHSSTTHQRLQQDSQEWEDYHDQYDVKRKAWSVDPMAFLLKKYNKSSGLEIGDFGCGRKRFENGLTSSHTVHNFDHVAFDTTVTVCDICETPLPDGQLDAAVYCLSLMGTNKADYIREANRVLKANGWLHIVETVKNRDFDSFIAQMEEFGFEQVSTRQLSDDFIWLQFYKDGDVSPTANTLAF